MTSSPFGRPGRRADIARELHEAFARHGIELLPGRARQIVDERVAEVAALMRFSERTALQHLPAGWAEEIAAAAAFDQQQAKMAEQVATGSAPVPGQRLGALIAGLAVCIQDGVWRVAGGLPASIGESLDCLTGLALSLQSVDVVVDVPRAELLAAARHLGSESDALRAGMDSPDQHDPPRVARVIERLADDAAWSRRAAR
jgi:hypothetical protein